MFFAKSFGFQLFVCFHGLTLEPTPECILKANGRERNSNRASVGQTGLRIDAVKFYEKQRLLEHPPRTEGGFCRFNTHRIQRIQTSKRSNPKPRIKSNPVQCSKKSTIEVLMRIEVLYFGGCPNYLPAVDRLRAVRGRKDCQPSRRQASPAGGIQAGCPQKR
jgi:hypothetical protein